MKLKKKHIILGAVLLFLLSLYMYPNLYIPWNYRVLANNMLLHSPDKFILHEGKFSIWEKGYFQVVEVKPKYTSIYCVSLEFDSDADIKNHYFEGKLRVEIFQQGELVEFSEFGPRAPSYVWGNQDVVTYELNKFFFPLKGVFWDDLSLRITVLEPAKSFKQYENSLVMRVQSGFVP